MKSILKGIGITIGGIVILVGIGFGTGELQAIYNRSIGKDIENSQNTKFHETQMYTDGKAQDLAKDRRELQTTTDKVARKAIINEINSEFANYNENNLQDASLKQFLLDVRNGNIN